MSKKHKGHSKTGAAGRKAISPREFCGKLCDGYLLFAFGLFPLLVGTREYGYSNIVDVKAWTWLGVTALWALLLVGRLIWARIKKQPVGARFGWVQWTAAAFLAVTVLSALVSGHVRECMVQMDPSNTNSVLFVASYVAAFLGLSLFGRLRREHMWALGAAVLLSGILCAAQLAGYNPLTMYPEGLTYYNKHQEYAGAFLGTMGNVDHLAAYLCFAVPVLTVYAFRAQDKKDRLLLLPALLSVYVLYAIDVDAAKVGIAGCLVVALPVVLRGRKAAKYACAGCAAVAVLGAVCVFFWPGQSGFLHEASQILHGHIEPSYGHDRVGIWQLAWSYVKQHPLLGNGPGSGAWLLQSIYTVFAESNRVAVVYNVHNTYLGYLMESGILALCCYIAIICRSGCGWVRRRMDDRLAALGAGIACYLVQDLFSLNLAVVAPFLWVGLGLLCGKAASDGGQPETNMKYGARKGQRTEAQ